MVMISTLWRYDLPSVGIPGYRAAAFPSRTSAELRRQVDEHEKLKACDSTHCFDSLVPLIPSITL